MEILEIVEGWRNHLFPPKALKEKIKEVSAHRLSICKNCDYNSDRAKLKGYTSLRKDYHCTNCGCSLEPKSKCLKCACPINNWGAILNEEEDKIFEEQIKNEGL